MADTVTVEGTATSGGSKKKLIVIVGAAVALVLVLVAVYFLVLAPKGGDDGAAAEPEAPAFSLDPGPILTVDETTVSLGGAEPHFAAVTYSVQVSFDADPALVEANFARMRSQAQRLFRTYDAAELNTTAGFDKLEADLTRVAQEVWPDGEVLAAYVESLLVQ